MYLDKVVKSEQIPPQRFHVGDRVVVTNPEFIERVGYPMSYENACNEIAATHMEAIEEMLGNTIFKTDQPYSPSPCALSLKAEPVKLSKDMQQLVGAMAKLHMKYKGFGGKQRSIHTAHLEDKLGLVCEVTSKRICKTGIYYPGGSSTSYEGEVDYWPGGLEDCKTHVLLELDVFFTMAHESKDWHRYPGTWIESKNVRLYDGPELTESSSAYAKRVRSIN
jgi:hypothetical protein